MPIKSRSRSRPPSDHPRPPDVQEAYNQEHGITPKTVRRTVIEDLAETFGEVVETFKEEGEKISHTHLRRDRKKISEYDLEIDVPPRSCV